MNNQQCRQAMSSRQQEQNSGRRDRRSEFLLSAWRVEVWKKMIGDDGWLSRLNVATEIGRRGCETDLLRQHGTTSLSPVNTQMNVQTRKKMFQIVKSTTTNLPKLLYLFQ